MSSMRSYLDLTVDEQLLHSLPVSLMQACVMHANPKGQRELQVGVPHCGDDRLDLQTNQSTDNDGSLQLHADREVSYMMRADLPNHDTVNIPSICQN